MYAQFASQGGDIEDMPARLWLDAVKHDDRELFTVAAPESAAKPHPHKARPLRPYPMAWPSAVRRSWRA